MPVELPIPLQQQQQQQTAMPCRRRAKPKQQQMGLLQPLQKLQMPQQLLQQLPMQHQQQQQPQQQCPMVTSSLTRCQKLRPGTLTWQMQTWRPLQVCSAFSSIRATQQLCVLPTDMMWCHSSLSSIVSAHLKLACGCVSDQSQHQLVADFADIPSVGLTCQYKYREIRRSSDVHHYLSLCSPYVNALWSAGHQQVR